jgi:hypothetical protein
MPGGVSLKYLFKLDEALAGATGQQLSVRELVDRVILPRTEAGKCR